MDPPLTATELGETSLPYTSQSDLDFESLGQILAFGRLELGEVTREKFSKDQAKVADSHIIHTSSPLRLDALTH